MNDIDIHKSDMREWATKGDLARHFKCSIRYVTELMQRRVIPYVKIGRFVRFDLAECDKAMEQFRMTSRYD